MSEIVASVLERDLAATERTLGEVSPRCALVEVRADRLPVEDIRAIVRRARRHVLVSIRRRDHGGVFEGSEEERARGLAAALEAGARWVDVEWNTPLGAWADGAHRERVVLSHHGAPCRPAALHELHREMASTGAARLKIVPRAASAAEILALRPLLAEGRGRLTAFASGRAGAASRILACSWGSWGTYGAVRPGAETASGQPTVDDLLDVHRVTEIGPATQSFALVGSRASASPSPTMHAAAHRVSGADAILLPVEADVADELEPLVPSAGGLGLAGLAVTLPFKEELARRCTSLDTVAGAARAVNTVRISGGRWGGSNTDGPALLAAARARLDPRGRAVAIVGAGGTAAAAAVVLSGAGARVTLYNRTLDRARELAARIGVAAAGLDALAQADWEILVQATPLGREGETIVAVGELRGRLVCDFVYGPEPTPLVRAARVRGLAVVEGFELLVAQAVLQCELLYGFRPSPEALAAAGRAWLERRRVAA